MELQYLLHALNLLVSPEAVITIVLSVFFGIVVGMLPGLTATMAVALLTGLTYKTSSDMAILSLIGVYVGAISGGCQSAILLNIPGTPASAATAQDGYPMGQQGRGGLAIFLATSASALGTLGSVIFLLFLTPLLTSFALKFGSWEFFLLAVFGIMICGQLASGGDPLKGWIAGILGLLASLVGIDGLQGVPRFSFDNIDLMAGFSLIPIMIGLFGFPEIVAAFKKKTAVIGELQSINYREGIRIMLRNWETIIRSTFIGVMVGIIPGVGEDVGGWLSYWAARMRSKARALFGKGNPEGVIAAETGNNACIGGAIIPILSLAVPGSAPAAVLMAAFWLHGLRPGPLMMTETPGFLYTVATYLVAASFIMWALGLLISRFTVKILQVSPQLLMPVVFLFCVVGSYVINDRIFDVWVMFAFGFVGLFLSHMKFPSAPFLLGVILGPMADTNLRRALTLSDGSILPFFTRPICLFFAVIIMLMIAAQMGLFSRWRSKEINQEAGGTK
jgi:putative tricarboxylic transport membrane protein